ncbi:hypothetical protein M446_4158 [Methylobacterium sp. 4-46]|uniref:hypothetical protein n=1 Tax=unclassified Methylobacterium TaxID=2615210 RepID=UPI000165C923|nr:MULTISPECIES: hypothetical protein [Methylobacterium]ACA18515.1 hypothetical protein M446_4158 [Methylobacterium sp. 4-46]WFT77801.1 hypothetical protein QA634_21105 [Methylobacterium nodulans]
MGLYTAVTVTVQVEGKDAMVLGPLDDQGMGCVLCPGTEERGLVLSALAEAIGILTGPRPGPIPAFAVYEADALTPARKRPHLSLVPKDGEAGE